MQIRAISDLSTLTPDYTDNWQQMPPKLKTDCFIELSYKRNDNMYDSVNISFNDFILRMIYKNLESLSGDIFNWMKNLENKLSTYSNDLCSMISSTTKTKFDSLDGDIRNCNSRIDNINNDFVKKTDLKVLSTELSSDYSKKINNVLSNVTLLNNNLTSNYLNIFKNDNYEVKGNITFSGACKYLNTITGKIDNATHADTAESNAIWQE